MTLMNALGWTLLHFVWEGALVALVLAVVLAALRERGARARYWVSYGALAVMLVCAAFTMTRFWRGDGVQPVQPASATFVITAPFLPQPVATSTPTPPESPRYFPALVTLWLAGVLVLSVRAAGGWLVAQRFHRGCEPAEAVWRECCARLAQRLAVSRPVRLCVSAAAEVPAVIGWARPVVLLPASALTGLSPEHIEALLAHELAHIRRNDYLLNLLQTVAETLLFYHPAVWWVSRQIRAEREHCCDDLAVETCGDLLVYARSLAQLEQLRQGMPALAMAADGGSLSGRIQRLLRTRRPVQGSGWAAGLVALAGLVAALVAATAVVGAQPNGERVPVQPSRAGSQNAQTALMAQNRPAEEQPGGAAAPPAQPAAPSWLSEIRAAGYNNLSVDQLVALKIQGVDGAYIRGLRAEGFQPTADQLVALKIQQVTPDYLNEIKGLGITVNLNQAMALRIQGATAEEIRKLEAQGFGNLTADQVIAMRIQHVTPEYVTEIKAQGIPLTVDQAIGFRIQGATAAEIGELKALGFNNLTADQVIAMRIQGVTPAFIRSARDQGLPNLTVDQLIRLKQFGILGNPKVI